MNVRIQRKNSYTLFIEMSVDNEEMPFGMDDELETSESWRAFPNKEAIKLVNMKSGLVVTLYEEEDGCTYCLEMYSLHNGSDSTSDYNSSLRCKFKSFEEAYQAFKELVVTSQRC